MVVLFSISELNGGAVILGKSIYYDGKSATVGIAIIGIAEGDIFSDSLFSAVQPGPIASAVFQRMVFDAFVLFRKGQADIAGVVH